MRLVKLNPDDVKDQIIKAYCEGQAFKITILYDKSTGIEFPTTFTVRGKKPWFFDWCRNIDELNRNDFYYIYGDNVLIAMFSIFNYKKNSRGTIDLAYMNIFEINPDYRRQGYGRKCLAMLEEYLKNNEGINKIGLEPIGTEDVHEFYLSCGYEWNDNAYRFTKELK